MAYAFAGSNPALPSLAPPLPAGIHARRIDRDASERVE